MSSFPVRWTTSQPKSDMVPVKLERQARTKARLKVDAKESEKVKARSGGRCEVVDQRGRCTRRAVHIHHELGGFGVRGRGASARAEHKRHVCERCHSDIHAHVLTRTGPTWTRRTAKERD